MDNNVKGYLVSGPEYTIFVAGDVEKSRTVLYSLADVGAIEDENDCTITVAEADITLIEVCDD